MSDRLLRESDVLMAIDRRIKELSADPEFMRKNGHIDVVGVKKHILALPSADRPRGEWIPCTKGGLPLTELGRRERQKWYGYKCSKCNFIYKGNALTESPFCQNCGARMEKIGEEKQTCESQDGADCTNCNLIGKDKCWDCVIKGE